jgi:hypothetical protein
MEAGMHSPWVSRFAGVGSPVIVVIKKNKSNFSNERKSDWRDATSGRLPRADGSYLLHPVKHGSQEVQQDMLQLKLRNSLVRARVASINAVRFAAGTPGATLPGQASIAGAKEVPESSVR